MPVFQQPQLGPVPPWPWPGVGEEDDADSDDSTEKGIVLVSPGGLGTAGEWIVRQAPIFLCGAAAAWLTLLVLWRSDGDALRAEVAAARVLLAELRHTSEVLRVEVGEARRLLTPEARAANSGKQIIDGAALSSDLHWAASMHVAPSHSASGSTGPISDIADSLGAVGEAPSWLEAWPLQALWTLSLFVLDAGLIFFCLRHCASQEAKTHLEVVLLRSLEKIGLGSWLGDPSRKPHSSSASSSSSAASKTGASSNSLSDSAAVASARVETAAADALLVRRRDGSELAPVHRMQQQRQADALRDLRKRRSSVALGVASVAGVAAARLVARSAAFVGLRFLNHLVMYAVLTVRVCLIVLLVLF